MKLQKHKQYPNMYYLVWEDGTKSSDFYNKTRASEIKRRLEQQEELKVGITREFPEMGRLD